MRIKVITLFMVIATIVNGQSPVDTFDFDKLLKEGRVIGPCFPPVDTTKNKNPNCCEPKVKAQSVERTAEVIRLEQLNASEEYFTNLFPYRDLAVSIELGAKLFMETNLSVNGGSSCGGASCHIPNNNFAPTGKLQASEGVVFLDKGFVECEFAPVNIAKDIMDINSPSIRGHKYKRLALHKGIEKALQPTLMFGAKQHQQNFEMLNEIPVYKYYIAKAFGVTEATEAHYVQAILDYEESLEVYTPYAEYLRTGKGNKLMRNTIVLLDEKGCLNCHQGLALVSDEFGQVVLNSTGKNVLKQDTVQTRSMNYSDNFDSWFWNASYIANSKIGLKKHSQNEGIELSDKEVNQISKFIKKACNE